MGFSVNCGIIVLYAHFVLSSFNVVLLCKFSAYLVFYNFSFCLQYISYLLLTRSDIGFQISIHVDNYI